MRSEDVGLEGAPSPGGDLNPPSPGAEHHNSSTNVPASPSSIGDVSAQGDLVDRPSMQSMHSLLPLLDDDDKSSRRSDLVTNEKPFSLKEMHAIAETMGIVGFKPTPEVVPNKPGKSPPRPKTPKAIAVNVNADPFYRPDVKRTDAVGLDAVLDDANLMNIKPLRCKQHPHIARTNAVVVQPQLTEREKRIAVALSPTPYVKFHSHESKEAREAYMHQIVKLRRYKLGLSPNKKVHIVAGDIFTGSAIAHENSSSLFAADSVEQQQQKSTESSSNVLDAMFDEDWEEVARNARFHFDDGSPKGLSASLLRSETREAPVELSNTKLKRSNTKAWHAYVDKSASVKRTLVVKQIPEHKMDSFRRADSRGIPASFAPLRTVPAEAIATERASSPPRSFTSSYRPQSKGSTPMNDELHMQQERDHYDLKANDFPNWNNPLQRSRLNIETATRVAKRDYLKCCQCSKGSCYWCDKCSLSYCADCWTSVPHHAYIEERDLPLPPPALYPTNDLATAVFPALANNKGQQQVKKTFSESLLRKAGTNAKSTDRLSASNHGDDAQFELVGDQDALRAKDTGKKSFQKGRKGGKKTSTESKREVKSPTIRDSSNHENHAPVLSVGKALGGGVKLSMGFSGAVSKNKKAIVGITSEYFPEEWQESRNNADISVYDGIPVYVNPNREKGM